MKRLVPVFALALLSPFVAEILLGATPLSRAASLPPLIMLYGGGAILIRELARRFGLSWYRMAWLAAAYALVEEGLVMQTIFSPDLFNAAASGGRALGVNWVWTEALIGYHIVWSILIPIVVVEICFPERRRQPWLGKTGTMIALACYTLGAVAIAITFRRFITPNFRAPALLLVFTTVIIATIITGALRPARPKPLSQSSGKTVGSGVAALTTFFAASLWLRLSELPQFLRHGLIVVAPMILAACLVWGFVAFLRWGSMAWSDLHRLGIVAGAVLASSISGVTVIKDGSAFDRAGQAICSVIALLSISVLAWCVRRKETATGAKLD